MKTIIFTILFSILNYSQLYADMADFISFQGFMTDTNNVAITNSNYTLTFSLWDDLTTSIANKLWEEDHIVYVERGIYSVNLGTVTPFPYTINFAVPCYLGIQVNGGDYLTQNDLLLPLSSTWKSFRANTSGGKLVKKVDADYTIQQTDDIILASGSITLTLPRATTCNGKIISIKNMGNTMITVAAQSDLINDKSNAVTLSMQYDEVTVLSNGIQWFTIGTSLESNLETLSVRGQSDLNDLTVNNHTDLKSITVSDDASFQDITTKSLTMTGKAILGDSTIDSLTVNHHSRLNSISVNGSGAFNDMTANSLFVSDASQLSNTSIDGTFTVDNHSSLKTLSVSDISNFDILTANSVTVNNAVQLSSTTVNGIFDVNNHATFQSMDINGAASFQGITVLSLYVSGNSLFSNADMSELTVKTHTNMNTLTANGLSSLSDVTANRMTVQDIASQSLEIIGTSILSATEIDSLTVNNQTNLKTIDVSGDASFQNITAQTLCLAGKTILAGSSIDSLTVNYHSNLNTISVNGIATFNDITANSLLVSDASQLSNTSIDGTFTVDNHSSLKTLSVSGISNFDILTANSVTVNNAVQLSSTIINGTFDVNNHATFQSMDINGAASFQGITVLSLYVSGNSLFSVADMSELTVKTHTNMNTLTANGLSSLSDVTANRMTVQDIASQSLEIIGTSILSATEIDSLSVNNQTNLKTIDVSGDASFQNITAQTLCLAGKTVLAGSSIDSLTVNYHSNLNTISVNGIATFNDITANTLLVSDASQLSNTSIDGTFTVDNHSFLKTLSVSGISNFDILTANSLTVNNSVQLSSTKINGTFDVNNHATFQSMDINGAASFQGITVLSLYVSGNSLFSNADMSELTVKTHTNMNTLTANGLSSLSDVTANRMTVQDMISQSLEIIGTSTLSTAEVDSLTVDNQTNLKTVKVSGDASFQDITAQTLYLTGKTILIDSSMDSLTVNHHASLNTILVNEIATFNDITANTLFVSDVSQLSNTSIDGTFTVDNHSSLKTLSVSGKANFDILTANSLTLKSQILSISNTTLSSISSESRYVTIPDRSGVIILTNDGNLSLTTSEIQDNAISQNKLINDSVNSSKIVDDSIIGSDIFDGTIQTIDIADLAVTYTKIADGSIQASKLASENQALTSGVSGQSLLSNGDGTFQWGTGGTDLTQDTVSVGSDTSAFTLTRPQHASGSATSFVIKGQNASGTNHNGGNIEFIPGSPTGSGEEGSFILHSSSENILQATNIENDGSELTIFQISRDGIFNPTLLMSDTNGISKIYLSVSGSSYYSAGNFGFGVSNPEHPIHMASGASCTSGGAWSDGSDINFKRDVKAFSQDALSIINQLRPVTYIHKNDPENKTQLGLIAQEVLPLVPEVVNGQPGGYGISYGHFIPLLIKAIQEMYINLGKQDRSAPNN